MSAYCKLSGLVGANLILKWTGECLLYVKVDWWMLIVC